VTEALPHGTPFHSGWKEKAAVVILRFPTQESMLDLRPQFNQLIDCQLTELVTEQTPGIDAECQA
jgi:hypothetical protein